jgi:hypothetical protein
LLLNPTNCPKFCKRCRTKWIAIMERLDHPGTHVPFPFVEYENVILRQDEAFLVHPRGFSSNPVGECPPHVLDSTCFLNATDFNLLMEVVMMQVEKKKNLARSKCW